MLRLLLLLLLLPPCLGVPPGLLESLGCCPPAAQALLAFHHLALYAGERDLGATLIDADDFLEQLRADLLGR